MPNQGVLIDSIPRFEAQALSEIESVLTSIEQIFLSDGVRGGETDPTTKEASPRTSNGAEHMKALKELNVKKVAAAIEADAGQALPGLREALAEAKAGRAGRVHTPEQVVARRRGRPAGSVAAVSKEPVKLRLDPDVLAALRATGDGWQTRINEMLRASLSLGGRLG